MTRVWGTLALLFCSVLFLAQRNRFHHILSEQAEDTVQGWTGSLLAHVARLITCM